MYISTIVARDLPEAWFLSLRQVLTYGHTYTVSRGSGVDTRRRELDLAVIQVLRPGGRPLVPDTPQGVPPPTSIDYVEEYLSYIVTEEKAPGEQYTYGQDLALQIPKIVEMYRTSGHHTNQAFMAVGDRNSIDLPDPQCLRGIDTRVRYGALHFVVYFRSWDLWGGFPPNLAALELLKEYMATEIGVLSGELIGISKGLHLYEYAWDMAKICAGE